MITEFSRLIDIDDYIEGQNFTRIHQIVCGLINVPLEVELQASTDIDTLNSIGRSALCYAVIHRRHDYVRKLLERGADSNIGNPSFLYAVKYNSSDFAIAKALLDYGAILGSFNKISIIDWWASVYGSEVLAVDELLVKHGIDPNLRGGKGETILMCLPGYSWPYHETKGRRLKQLIELGSNIEIADEVGMTVIMYAVFEGWPDTFDILARAGARLDLKSASGSTILHLAIYHKYPWQRRNIPELCDLIHDADLTNLDLDAEDKNGNTAFDLLRIRNGPDWEHHCKHNGTLWYRISIERELEAELKAVSALEDLLHYVQEVQGVPEADRYPPLGEYGTRVAEEQPVPGAWPGY